MTELKGPLGLVAGLCLAACTSQGGGTGVAQTPAVTTTVGQVGAVSATTTNTTTFDWRTDGTNANRGTLSADVAGHETFRGNYLRVNTVSDAQDARPYFSGYYDEAWNAWEGWQPQYTEPRFYSHESGKAIAVLTNSEGERMRCRFQLESPAFGLAKGATGQCQLSTGELIDSIDLKEHTD